MVAERFLNLLKDSYSRGQTFELAWNLSNFTHQTLLESLKYFQNNSIHYQYSIDDFNQDINNISYYFTNTKTSQGIDALKSRVIILGAIPTILLLKTELLIETSKIFDKIMIPKTTVEAIQKPNQKSTLIPNHKEIPIETFGFSGFFESYSISLGEIWVLKKAEELLAKEFMVTVVLDDKFARNWVPKNVCILGTLGIIYLLTLKQIITVHKAITKIREINTVGLQYQADIINSLKDKLEKLSIEKKD